MLAESVILSIIVGVLRRKKIRSLENIKINKLWLIIISFSIEFSCGLIIKNNIKPLSAFISKNYFIIHTLIYILIFLFFIFNFKAKYLKLVFIGILLNFIVIAANNGLMPVNVDAALSNNFTESVNILKQGEIAGHAILIKGETKFWFLADIINIPPPYPFPQTISIGDVFIALGMFLFIQHNMKKTMLDSIF